MVRGSAHVFNHLLITIDALRGLFAAYGIPEEVVCDNGPQLVSTEFTDFLKGNGIKHSRVPAYHPASNGAAERSVQILKHSFLKSVCEKQSKQMLSLKHKLANFLIMYRSTPHSVTGKTPSKLFLKRHIRTCFSLLKPDLAKSVHEKQQEQKKHHDKGRRVLRSFVEEEPIRIQNFRGGHEKWLSGTVIELKGPVSYLVQEGQRRRTVHVDHMLPRNSAEASPMHGVLGFPNSTVTEGDSGPLSFPSVIDCSMQITEPKSPENKENLTAQDTSRATSAVEAVHRYPERIRIAPTRLDL